MRVDYDIKLGFSDVLIRPKRSTLKSRSEVSLNREYRFRHASGTWEGVPIIAANMDTVGTFSMATALSKEKLITAIHKHYSVEQWRTFLKNNLLESANHQLEQHFAISVGLNNQDYKQLHEILAIQPNIRFICLDVANGYTETFVDFVKTVRKDFPEKIIIAGNVVTGEMVEELILSGADIVKVGIGPGSVCTTRLKTGVGYPQLSAIMECADAAHGLNGLVVSDGGCQSPGDVAKAFGAGADFVMLGGMLAGHDECEGEIIQSKTGESVVEFYGMSSATAMQKHHGGVNHYRASEGKKVHIPYRGSVRDTVQDILGGVRSACTYVGANRLKELSKRTTFVRVQEQENRIFSS